MIICGNIYLDEINKTFLLKCVLCEKKSKAYTEFTKHIKTKHKTIEPDGLRSEKSRTIAKPNEESIKIEDDDHDMDNDDEEKPLIQIKHEMEMEFLDEYNDEVKYDVALETEPFADPIQALEEKETLDIRIPGDDFDDSADIKDDDYVPHDFENDTEDDDYDDDGGSESVQEEEEEQPVFTDKFNPTFFRKKRFLIDFIDLYKSQTPLWDVNHADFENTPVRKECERAIINGMHKFNVYLKSAELNRALNTVQKYCAIIKHNIENNPQKKMPEFSLGYYKKCDFLKELIVKKNISGYRDLSKTKPLDFKQANAKTTTFVEILEKFPILYNGDHPSYGDVDGRQLALEEMSAILKAEHNIDFNEDVITNAIEQLQSWYYKAKQRKDKLNNKLSKSEERYYNKCKIFMPLERLRYRYICKICNKNFNLRHNLQCHLFKIHNIGELPFACDQCERKFESKFALQAHIQRIHVGKTYPCKFCDRKFAVPSELKIHTSIHSTEKPHTCELCGKSFRLRVQLGYHVTAIHTKIRAFKCTMCPKDFLKKRDLTDHIKSHLNIRDKICETCGKGFSNCHSLIRHRQIHSEVKKFACKLCDAKFHQFVGLNGHMKRTHNIVKKPV